MGFFRARLNLVQQPDSGAPYGVVPRVFSAIQATSA